MVGDPNLYQKIVDVLKTVYDPEIPVNIWELGLVYSVSASEKGAVYVEMTLTAPMCPVAESLPMEVREKILAIPGVTGVKLDLIWDPPWDPERMTEEARLTLGM